MAETTTFPNVDLFPSSTTFPGTSSSNPDPGGSDIPQFPVWEFEVVFGEPKDHQFETGCDRGIMFDKATNRHSVWSGFKSLAENNDTQIVTTYAEGIVSGFDVTEGEYSASIVALYYPELLQEKLGDLPTGNGMYVTNQMPTLFDLTYRTLVGSGETGDQFGHKLHFVYNCMATVSQKSYRTVGLEAPDLSEFTFEIKCLPEVVPQYMPTAHYIVDARKTNKEDLRNLESVIYGRDGTLPRMPSVIELFEILS